MLPGAAQRVQGIAKTVFDLDHGISLDLNTMDSPFLLRDIPGIG